MVFGLRPICDADTGDVVKPERELEPRGGAVSRKADEVPAGRGSSRTGEAGEHRQRAGATVDDGVGQQGGKTLGSSHMSEQWMGQAGTRGPHTGTWSNRDSHRHLRKASVGVALVGVTLPPSTRSKGPGLLV